MEASDEMRITSLGSRAWCSEFQPPSNTLVDEVVVERRHLSLLCLGVADDGVQLIVGQRVKVELDEAVANHVCHGSHLLN